MQSHSPTTPFGRRSLTLAHVASQMVATARPPEKVVHKWKIFHAICAARPRLGVSERSLSVLNALLTFHPETALDRRGRSHRLPIQSSALVARPRHAGLHAASSSGRAGRRWPRSFDATARTANATRARMAPARSSLRSVLICRHSSFAQKSSRAWRPTVETEARALKLVRERITLCRRDIAKMIATGIEEGVPTRRGGQGPADWQEVHAAFRAIVDQIPRTATRQQLEPIAEELSQLADDVLNLLETHIKSKNLSANESHIERHIQNSNPNPSIDLEPSLQEGRAARAEPKPQPSSVAEGSYPLGMVLNACPDIVDYAKGGISNWRDFLATAAVVRSMLGISPSAWEEAQTVMGEMQAAVVVACILQRGTAIRSAGGYLRGLTRKAEAGEFSLGPILMSQINSRLHEKRRA